MPFPMVGSWLVWKVGKGNRVRLGVDPWVGCGKNYRLSENLVNILGEKGYFTLSKVAHHDCTTIWNQEWKPANVIGLIGEEATEWEGYIDSLKVSYG